MKLYKIYRQAMFTEEKSVSVTVAIRNSVSTTFIKALRKSYKRHKNASLGHLNCFDQINSSRKVLVEAYSVSSFQTFVKN